MKKKNQYISPKIKAVELNAEQAIFQVCKVSGAYISTYQTNPNCYARGGITQISRGCSNSVRGISENWSSANSSLQALPS